jgi:hypothetical protein
MLAFGNLLAVAATVAASHGPHPVRVTVVVVLASTNPGGIDPKLADLAAEVRKREPQLVTFKLADSLQKSIPVGGSHTFALPDRQKLKVTINRPRDRYGRVGLTICPPELGDITYSCMCNKFFPVVTPHATPDGERLILVVMAKPCPGK